MDKITYLEIAKRGINIQTSKPKNSNKHNNTYIDVTRIKYIINKILKHERNHVNINQITNNICNIIINTKNDHENIVNSMIKINNILKLNNICKLINNNKNHLWVSQKIIDILKKHQYHSNIKIVDIGSGEGDIILNISELYDVPTENLYAVEQSQSWAEEYKFNNNINYVFWDNNNLNLEPNTIDVIIIMVTMHHMSDETLSNLMLNIKKILKHDGIIIIKEHDLTNNEIKKIIDWEHHLYHILMSDDENLSKNSLDEYLKNFVNNYKSKRTYDKIFNENNFIGIEELNRKFEPIEDYEPKNASNLYWKIYKYK